MEHILEIDNINNDKHNIICIGLALETGTIKYYSFFDNNGNYNSNMLTEFDPSFPNHPKIEELFKNREIRPRFSESLPEELTNVVPIIIGTHHLYNEKNNLSNKNLEYNSKILSVQYMQAPYKGLNERPLSGKFDPITFSVQLNPKERSIEKNYQTLIHEIGHMKVTEYSIKNKLLYLKVGFAEVVFRLVSATLDNGDIYYERWKLIHNIDMTIRVLEELINDQECRSAFSTYKGKYPRFGDRLNFLCDQTLNKARSIHEIEIYYEKMYSIIKSRSMATELLEMIKISIYSVSKLEKVKSKEEADKMIKEYERLKIRQMK